MKVKYVYLILSIVGFILPYSHFVPWTNANGFNIGLMLSEATANPIAAGISVDALIAAIAAIIWIILDQKRQRVPFFWVSIIGMFGVGIAFAFPLYLFFRENVLEKKDLV